MRFKTLSLLFVFAIIGLIPNLSAQHTGIIRGTVKDKNTQEPLIGVAVGVVGSTVGTSTDLNGNYRITNVPVGYVNVKASLVGYVSETKFNISLSSGNDQVVNFELVESSQDLKEVEITFDKGQSAVAVDMVTPLSVQALTTEEIRSNPGGNFDVSRVIQALPGVAGASAASFRNDIIIRGGAPNENVFYLDGIEIPVINHFQTQGSSGGPAGILNTAFIDDIKLASSAFDARYDNALASVFSMRQRDGNPERLSGNLRLSSTEFAASLEGPAGKKTNFMASARRSYLQLLFEAIDLPIRPNYWDFQFKVNHKINDKTTLSVLGVGAIDVFSFGVPRESTPDKTFILNSTPSIEQWNYTNGASIKRLVKHGYVNVALSRNMFNNQLDRFENKDEGNENARILKLRSQEIENKFRIDYNQFRNEWKYAVGAVAQYVKFNNTLYNRIVKESVLPSGDTIPEVALNYATDVAFFRYGAFAQVSRRFFNQKFLVSAGLRTDGNSFTQDGNNFGQTLSPRLSLSYTFLPKWNLNASVGDYYKIPTYTVLGYKNSSGVYANKDAKYIRSTHYVAGLEFLPKEDRRFTLEGFYKRYSNYPVSLSTGISLANLGGGFDVLGNEAVRSIGGGETYGAEFYFQQKLVKKVFAVYSYTFVRSRFSGLNGQLIASSWDNRHLVSALFGYKLRKGWEIGAKFRFAGGTPYTPFDTLASRFNFATTGVGVLDYSRLNTERLINFSQFDLRIDKKFFFAHSTLDIFIDIQNMLQAPNPDIADYSFKRNADNTGFETTDGQPLKPDGSNGIPILLKDETPLTTPAIGIIFEF